MAGLKEPKVIINSDECKGCGLCIDICPENVLEFTKGFNKMGYHPAGYKGQGCIGCGYCFYQCPEPGAIIVYKKGYIEEEVEA